VRLLLSGRKEFSLSVRAATIAVLILAVVTTGATAAPDGWENILGWPVVGAAVATMLAGLLTNHLGDSSALAVEHKRARLCGALIESKLADLDPVADLRVHPVWTPYVPRAVDSELDRVVNEGGLIVIKGGPAAGKTRSAYEALLRVRRRGGLRVVVPRDGVALRRAVESGYRFRQKVVWLDDLERFLSPAGLDDSLVRAMRLAARNDLVIMATVRSDTRLHGGSRLLAGATVLDLQ
jgi:hypothetical protein